MSDGVNTGGPVCFFTFDKLCNANVGAADYIALANKFHTIALSGVPVFTADIRSQAYRCALTVFCCVPLLPFAVCLCCLLLCAFAALCYVPLLPLLCAFAALCYFPTPQL